jgi:N-acetyl-gamma-glutamyl-phosphate reductase
VFCALPHGASQSLVPAIVDDVAHIVDLGADFRLPADVYTRWYGDAHHAPELVGRFAYGLVELYREDLATHAHVASPGCYPTAVSLACAPLLAMRLVEPRLIADAVSGVSGAGRGLKTTSLFSEANENVSAYGLLTHRHTAEMEQALSKVAQRPVDVLFTPHLVPTTRGILATCYARPAAPGLSTARLLEHYRDFYANDPCVIVVDEPSGTKATYGANVVHVTVRFDERTDTVIAIAAEDNLVKGASGQMIQAANIVLGMPETTGLPLLGTQP